MLFSTVEKTGMDIAVEVIEKDGLSFTEELIFLKASSHQREVANAIIGKRNDLSYDDYLKILENGDRNWTVSEKMMRVGNLSFEEKFSILKKTAEFNRHEVAVYIIENEDCTLPEMLSIYEFEKKESVAATIIKTGKLSMTDVFEHFADVVGSVDVTDAINELTS